MIVELHNEPGNFRLTYPKTELRTSPLEFPIVLTRTLVDKNGSLWNVEVSNVKLEGLHKKEILVYARGSIIVHKDKKKIFNRKGLLFIHKTNNQFWNNYLDYTNSYKDLYDSEVYKKGDEKTLSNILMPINNKLMELAASLSSCVGIIHKRKEDLNKPNPRRRK